MTRLTGLVPRLKADGRLVADVGGKPVLLLRHGGRIYAMQTLCSHRGAPLSDATVLEGLVVCAWHRSAFRLADGSVGGGPAVCPLATYQATADGDDVVIEMGTK